MKLGDEGQGSLAGRATPEPVSVGSGRGWGPERPACLWVPARWRAGLAWHLRTQNLHPAFPAEPAPRAALRAPCADALPCAPSLGPSLASVVALKC